MEFASDVSIDRAKGVHLGQLLRLNEANLELLELFLDLGRHENNFTDRVRPGLVVQLDLFVSRALHCDADL